MLLGLHPMGFQMSIPDPIYSLLQTLDSTSFVSVYCFDQDLGVKLWGTLGTCSGLLSSF